MGCFLSCFRSKDDSKKKCKFHLISNSSASKSKDSPVSNRQLTSILISEEIGFPRERFVSAATQDYIDDTILDKDLEDEAKFLKSCGALLETPAEIRKAPGKLVAQTVDKDDISSNFSCLPGTSPKKLLWDEKLEESSFQQNSSSCFDSEGHVAQRHHPSSLPAVSSSNSVVLDISPSQAEKPLGPKFSPYPTPLKLTDEMETPGSIYPANLDNLRSRKHSRVRTQYVYPVLNPVENISQWTELRQGSFQPGQAEKAKQMSLASPKNLKDERSLNREAYDKENYDLVERQNVTPLLDRTNKVPLSPENPQLVVTSLSQWLKPPSGNDEKGGNETIGMNDSCPEQTPGGDRPIFGGVALHWNGDESSYVSPFWWGKNGIPNTTTKYKEDQKVSWHATPFEKRLDKALSDEKLFPQRKLTDRKLDGLEDGM